MFGKIVLAGGSGYLGQVLARYYKDKAAQIVILTRKEQPDDGNIRYVIWDGATAGDWVNTLEGADMLINLCGKNVNCRYTPQNRKAIIESRVVPTQLLSKVITTLRQPPKMWMNLASATIYRHAEDKAQYEKTGDIGYGFSIDVCKAWENSFWKAHTTSTTKVVLRTGIVFGRYDGVFPRLKSLVKVGLGGYQGTGHQYVSWIHEEDFARITAWIFENSTSGETYNCTAPEAVTNKFMMKTIRNSFGIPVGLPSPQWLLELGARLIGTETELILKSRWVYPGNLLSGGYKFLYHDFKTAISEILSCRL